MQLKNHMSLLQVIIIFPFPILEGINNVSTEVINEHTTEKDFPQS